MDNLFLFLNKDEDAPVSETNSVVNTETDDPVVTVVKLKKKYDQSQYNKNFLEKNKDKINKKIICDICCGSYSYYNKSKHLKSVKHINLLNKQNQNKN
jgi:hypothetical protein